MSLGFIPRVMGRDCITVRKAGRLWLRPGQREGKGGKQGVWGGAAAAIQAKEDTASPRVLCLGVGKAGCRVVEDRGGKMDMDEFLQTHQH